VSVPKHHTVDSGGKGPHIHNFSVMCIKWSASSLTLKKESTIPNGYKAKIHSQPTN
jgi:hypothetical protein